MSVRSSLFRLVLLAGAAGTALAMPAVAQDARTDDAAYQGPETIEVIAPNYQAERHTLGLPGKVSLSVKVAYDDLDLRTREGAHELRARVADAARDVCKQLADDYPVRQQPGATKCYEGAYKDGMFRADQAIRDARSDRY